MLRTDVVSDDLWALIEPLMPSGSRPGRPWNDHRLTLEGIIWRFRTGSPWRDLPDHFGAWQSVAERHLRWSTDGTYGRVFAAIQDGMDDDGVELLRLSVDSTSVRAHQHAAGRQTWCPHRGLIRITRFRPMSLPITRSDAPGAG